VASGNQSGDRSERGEKEEGYRECGISELHGFDPRGGRCLVRIGHRRRQPDLQRPEDFSSDVKATRIGLHAGDRPQSFDDPVNGDGS
jgi:hypothetical protein